MVQCSRCGGVNDSEGYDMCVFCRDYLKSVSIVGLLEPRRQGRPRNPKKSAAEQRAYGREYSRRYYAKNKEKILATAKEKRAAEKAPLPPRINTFDRKEYDRRYRLEHRDRIKAYTREYSRLYYKEHQDRLNAYACEYNRARRQRLREAKLKEKK